MTIRQIAETAGCSLNTVRKVGKDIYPNKRAIKSGIALDYSKDESINIMDKLPKSNYIADPNLTNIGNPIESTTNGFDMKMFADMMAVSLATALKPIYDRLDSVETNKTLQIEHVPEKPTRAIFRQHIDKLVKLSNSDWSTIYNAVYSEMGYVYNVKIKARAKNRDIKPIDVLEQDGLMGKAIAITRQMIERLEK